MYESTLFFCRVTKSETPCYPRRYALRWSLKANYGVFPKTIKCMEKICSRWGFENWVSHNPLTLLGIRLKSAMVVKNERTGMTYTLNWTDGDDLPRGIEIGCFFGLFTRIYSLTPSGRSDGRYLQKKCDKSEFLHENTTRIQFSNGRTVYKPFEGEALFNLLPEC